MPPKYTIGKGNVPISGSDRKKLRGRVQQSFPLISGDQLDALLPTGKADDVRLTKLGKRDELYTANGQPVFLSLDGELVPTCYSLHVAPQIMRQVFVYPGVQKHVCRGADLFLPGVVRPDDLASLSIDSGVPWPDLVFGAPFSKGELCALVTAGDWAPFAVGTFALSSTDALEWGLGQGVGVSVLQHIGDELWETGSKRPAAPEPPASAAAALSEHAQRAERAAAAAAAAVAEKKQREEIAREQERYEGLLRRRRKVEKLLRENELLRQKLAETNATAKDAAQAAKLASDAKLRAEAAEISADLDRIGAKGRESAGAEGEDWAAGVDSDSLAMPQPPRDFGAEGDGRSAAADNWEDIADSSEAQVLGGEVLPPPAPEPTSGNSQQESGNAGGNGACADEGAEAGGASSDGGDAPAADEEDDAVDVDALFTAAFFAALAEEQLPALANVVFAHAGARLPSGLGIKQTSWKKAGKFLEEFADCVKAREPKPGVTEIVSFDAARAAAVDMRDLRALEADAAAAAAAASDEGGNAAFGDKAAAVAAVRATKKGSAVTVTVRKVRGKNVTFVDGLESWGIARDGMELLAKDFRRRFSASASVGERKGTEGGRRQLWSVQVQGKYAEQLAAALRERGVTKVNVSAKAGILTKQDRVANV